MSLLREEIREDRLEEMLWQYGAEQRMILPDEVKVKKTIQKSKDAFDAAEQERPLAYFEFVYQQMTYIRKRWWIFQFLILGCLWRILCLAGGGIYWQRGMGVLVPLFVVMLVPELWKNRMNAAVEIEGTTWFSLRQIYAARMFLFAAVDLLILSFFFAVISFTVPIPVGEILIQFFLPFNVTCCICFRTLCSRWNGTEYFAVAMCLIWSAVWVQILLEESIYATITDPLWAGAVVISALYLGFCIYKTLNNCENYMEVNQVWN